MFGQTTSLPFHHLDPRKQPTARSDSAVYGYYAPIQIVRAAPNLELQIGLPDPYDMAFLFGRTRTRSTNDLVKSTKDLMTRMVTEEKLPPKVSASECSRSFLGTNICRSKKNWRGT